MKRTDREPALHGAIPASYGQELQYLVFKMLEKDMHRRPTAQQILKFRELRPYVSDGRA